MCNWQSWNESLVKLSPVPGGDGHDAVLEGPLAVLPRVEAAALAEEDDRVARRGAGLRGGAGRAGLDHRGLRTVGVVHLPLATILHGGGASETGREAEDSKGGEGAMATKGHGLISGSGVEAGVKV